MEKSTSADYETIIQKLQSELIAKQEEIQRLKESEMSLADANVRIAELYVELEEAYDKISQSKIIEEMNQKLSLSNEELAASNEELSSSLETIQLQNKLIAKKNADTLASLNYACRIQNAMLPSQKYIKSLFPQSFTFFKPRDIVSGDYYWVHEKGDFIIFTVFDCTGHGVPGAFMSLLGDMIISQAVLDYEIVMPDTILCHLNQKLKDVLNQEESDAKDGMDIAVCAYHRSEKKLYFSGAMNSLFYIKNGSLSELKGDKKPIGSTPDTYQYALHSITIEEPTWVYLSTDGYPDQFGGREGRKFLIKRFKTMLEDIHTHSCDEQQTFLENTFMEWVGNQHPQTDDVLIIGICLS